MVQNDLLNTITAMTTPGKGILAADESTGTMGKRLASINADNTEQNRCDYRRILFSTEGLGDYIHGAILFEETLDQKDASDTLLTELLLQQDILPGIKVDKGLVDLANSLGEKVTQGLDGLSERLQNYKEKGAQFAKWRNVYSISDATPSITAIKTGAEVLARYAAVCQELGVVPIVEPEVLIDGDHTIEQCAEVTEIVLHELYNALFIHQVELEYTILKPSMVISGKDCPTQANADEIAEYTLSVFRNNVPASVPTINFLSGGQTPEQATENLKAINSRGQQPWLLSFSYGRALQENALKAWAGNNANQAVAQSTLLESARANSAACMGE